MRRSEADAHKQKLCEGLPREPARAHSNLPVPTKFFIP